MKTFKKILFMFGFAVIIAAPAFTVITPQTSFAAPVTNPAD